MALKSEQEIIDGIMLGDEITLASFYRQHLPYIKNHILKKGGSKEDAEDIFQDALLVMYLKLKSNDTLISTTIGAYFYGVCKNLWLNRLRKERKWLIADILADDFKDPQTAITDQIQQKDRKKLFNTYFSTLHTSTKQLWSLFFEEKNSKEVSLAMGYTEKYVRKKKCETKKELIQTISKDPLYKELADI